MYQDVISFGGVIWTLKRSVWESFFLLRLVDFFFVITVIELPGWVAEPGHLEYYHENK